MGDWTLFAAPPRPNPAKVCEFPPELGGLSVLECQDASNECRHGRLPFDPSPVCGCFPGVEVAAVTVLPVPVESREKAA